MIIPVLYLALVWIAVWKFRRRWQSAVILMLAPVPLLVATSLLSVISRSPDAALHSSNFFVQNLIGFGSVIHALSASYIVIMLIVGTIIAVAKPSVCRVPCGRCGYDLAGTTALRCPECGGHLSVCVQELRMQVYMADREAASRRADPEPAPIHAAPITPNRSRSVPAHLKRSGVRSGSDVVEIDL